MHTHVCMSRLICVPRFGDGLNEWNVWQKKNFIHISIANSNAEKPPCVSYSISHKGILDIPHYMKLSNSPLIWYLNIWIEIVIWCINVYYNQILSHTNFFQLTLLEPLYQCHCARESKYPECNIAWNFWFLDYIFCTHTHTTKLQTPMHARTFRIHGLSYLKNEYLSCSQTRLKYVKAFV